MPSFAYVTNSSHCDNTDLSTYTGPANLTANWQGNTINVTWYNGDTEYDSNSCTYGGSLTMPSSIPQKTGYTFKGWRARRGPVCEIPSSLVNSNGELDIEHPFSVIWSGIGEVLLDFKCSITNGTRATVGNPSDADGQHCWCAAIAWTPEGGTQCNITAPVWVYSYADEDFDECETYCNGSCKNALDADFKRALFGVSQ